MSTTSFGPWWKWRKRAPSRAAIRTSPPAAARPTTLRGGAVMAPTMARPGSAKRMTSVSPSTVAW
jgi:hypothetical protein